MRQSISAATLGYDDHLETSEVFLHRPSRLPLCIATAINQDVAVRSLGEKFLLTSEASELTDAPSAEKKTLIAIPPGRLSLWMQKRRSHTNFLTRR